MNYYLLPGLEATPAAVKRMIDHIAPAQRDMSIGDGRFTPREVIAHLADWEPIFRARMAAMIETPERAIRLADEGEMAVAHDYAHSDVEQQCACFAAERAATIAFLRSLEAGAWEKTGLHPEKGPISVHDQANMLLGHDLYHVEQLSASL